MDLDFAPIALDRQEEYLALLGATPQLTSDYSLVNLWSWAEEYGLGWAWADGLVWIRQTKPTLAYWAPVGPWSAIEWRRVMERLVGRPFIRLPENLALLMVHGHPRARLKSSREHWDYLYSVPELVALSGNRFHAKHNLLRQFQSTYPWHYRPLDERMIERVLMMQDQWCAWRNCDSSADLAAEDRAIAKVLGGFASFKSLLGGVLLVESHVVAFTVADPLRPDTLVIHFEKGMSSYKGVYQAMNREFLAAQSGFTLVNREQDLGNQGLRKAKLSYHPVGFLRKYELLWI